MKAAPMSAVVSETAPHYLVMTVGTTGDIHPFMPSARYLRHISHPLMTQSPCAEGSSALCRQHSHCKLEASYAAPALMTRFTAIKDLLARVGYIFHLTPGILE